MAKYDFQWFEKEDRRKILCASVSRDGKLRLGRALREALPPYIRIGFDSRLKVLAIADGRGAGISWPRSGVLTAQALSARISATGLRLPVTFRLTPDDVSGLFLGRIVPRRRCSGLSPGAPQYDTEQLMLLYRHILDDGVRQLARSTPLAERRAFAVEAFCTAASEYRPGFGDLETYLETQVRSRLIQENRQFTHTYADLSLEMPVGGSDGESRRLADFVPGSGSGGIEEAEARIMLEQFADSLPHDERLLFAMMLEGRRVPQIASALGIDERTVLKMARLIGQKRRRFYETA